MILSAGNAAGDSNVIEQIKNINKRMWKKHDIHLEMLRTQSHKFCTHLACCDIILLRPPNKYTVPFIRAHHQHHLRTELPILLLIKSSEKVRACQSTILILDVCTVINLCWLWSLKCQKNQQSSYSGCWTSTFMEILDFFFQVEQISFWVSNLSRRQNPVFRGIWTKNVDEGQ